MAGWKRVRDFGPQLVVGLVFAPLGAFLVLGGLGLAGGGFPAGPWVTVTVGVAVLIPGAGILLHALYRLCSPARRATAGVARIAPVERARGIAATWVAATFVVLLTIGMAGAFAGGKATGDMPEWLAFAMLGVFGIVGLVLAAYATWLTLGAVRFGRLPLHLVENPPRIGGRLAAFVELPAGFRPRELKATLRCFRIGGASIDAASARGESTGATSAPASQIGAAMALANALAKSVRADWKTTRTLRPGPDGRLDVEFPIPPDLPPSNFEVHDERPGLERNRRYETLCRWELKLEAEVAGPDLSRTYELPVRGPQESGAERAPGVESESPDRGRRLRALENLAASALDGGATPADVVAKLAGLGLPDDDVRAALGALARRDGTPWRTALADHLAEAYDEDAPPAGGSLMLFRRVGRRASPRTDGKDRARTGAGPPVELAGPAVLARRSRRGGRAMLAFGSAWIVLLAVGLVVERDVTAGGVVVILGIALVSLAIGVFALGLHRAFRLLPERGLIEEKSGWYGSTERKFHRVDEFARVAVRKHVRHHRKGGVSILFRVYLRAADPHDGDLPFGEFRYADGALAHAIGVARALRFDVEIDDGEDHPAIVPFAELDTLAERSRGMRSRRTVVTLTVAGVVGLVLIGAIAYALMR